MKKTKKKNQASLEHILIFGGVLIFSVIVSVIVFQTTRFSHEVSIVTYDKYRASLKGVELVGYDKPYDGTPETAPKKIIYKGDEYEPEFVAEGNASGHEIVEIGTNPSGGGFGLYYRSDGRGGIQLEAICPSLDIDGLVAHVLSREETRNCPAPGKTCRFINEYVLLEWQPITTDVSGCFSYYEIVLNGTTLGETTSTTFEYDPPSGEHLFNVNAINANGKVVASAETTATVSDGSCVCPPILPLPGPTPPPPQEEVP